MASLKIEISRNTIFFSVFFLLFLWFLYVIKAVILAIFAALILMTALNSLVTRFEKKKIPRSVASGLLLILIIIVFTAVIASMIPAVIDQTRSLIILSPKQ